MELDFALLAERADSSRDSGLLHIFGATVNIFRVTGLPMLVQCAVVMRFKGATGEQETVHDVSIDAIGTDGNRSSATVQCKLGTMAADQHNPPAANLIVQTGLLATAPGPCSFVICIDGKAVKTLPFVIEQITEESLGMIKSNKAPAEAQ